MVPRSFAPASLVLSLVAGSALIACSSASESSGPTPTTTNVGGGGSTTTTGGSGGSGGEVGGAGAGAAGGQAGCPVAPACTDVPPNPGPAQPWRHTIQTPIVTGQGAARHRGRDLFLNPADAQWVLAKFSYGLADDDLVDEDVDLYLQRGCTGQWEKLGPATTTDDGDHATVDGVEDTGGRVFYAIPENLKLGVGRHRIHMVVLGDLTTAEQIIEVVEPGTKIFVADIDGTLTLSDSEQWTAMLTGALPAEWPSSAAALNILASKGLRPFYLTARPEWLDSRSREFLQAKGYPPGIMHTTFSFTGASGAAAVTYKSDDLTAVLAKGVSIEWAFGNASTDAEAYDNANIQPINHRIYVGLDDPYGGRRIEDWTALPGEFEPLPTSCP